MSLMISSKEEDKDKQSTGTRKLHNLSSAKGAQLNEKASWRPSLALARLRPFF